MNMHLDLDDAAHGNPLAVSQLVTLREQVAHLEIEARRLVYICTAAHDRLLRGDSDQALLALLETSWKQ